MKPIIKSSQVTDQPVLLYRTRKSDPSVDIAGEDPAIHAPFEEAGEGRAMPAGGASAMIDDAGEPRRPPPREDFTYDKFRQRFDDELRALEQAAIQEGFERGSKEGFDRGYAEGRAQAAAEQAAQAEALEEFLASARAAFDQSIDGMTDLGAEIVFEAVTKIVGRATLERDAVVAIVREVVRQAKERARLVVRVSPSDWSLLDGCRERLTDGLDVARLELVADERVRLGGCLLETPAGNLDARLEVQLDRLRETLLQAARAGTPPESV